MNSYTEALDDKKIKDIVDDLHKIISYCKTAKEIRSIKRAIIEVEKSKQKYVITEAWNPNRCPTCWEDLGGDCNDGYYDNPYYESCPKCRQRLKYK